MPKPTRKKVQKKGPCGKRNCKCPLVKTQYVLPVTSRTKRRYRGVSRPRAYSSGPSDVATALAAFDLNDQYRKRRKLAQDGPTSTKETRETGTSSGIVLPQSQDASTLTTARTEPRFTDIGTAEIFSHVPGRPQRTPARSAATQRRYDLMRRMTPVFPTVIAPPDMPTPTVTGEPEIPEGGRHVAVDINPSPSPPTNIGYTPSFGLDIQPPGVNMLRGVMWAADGSPPEVIRTPAAGLISPPRVPVAVAVKPNTSTLMSPATILHTARNLFGRKKSLLPR